MSKQVQRRRFGLTGVAVAAALALLTGCGTDDRGPSEPDDASRGLVVVDSYLVEGTTVTLIVMSCHGEPQAEVAESDQDVRVSVISTTSVVGDACQDTLEIALAKPLGQRVIIDEFSGQEVPAP